jgi:hypothetical protein
MWPMKGITSRRESREVSIGICLVVFAFAAFMTRALPLSISPNPFNNDSITESAISSQVLSTGHIDLSANSTLYDTHGFLTPILDVLLAYVAGALGTNPNDVAQLLDSMVSICTILGVLLICRTISGSLRGGISGSFTALTLGTFVFTTGSAWKEMLGISLFVLGMLAFISRDQSRFRMLCFIVLVMIPFEHHLVAAVMLLTFAYMIAWSWFFAFEHQSLRRRHWLDLVMVAIPAALALIYYWSALRDRISAISSGLGIILFISFCALVSLVCFVFLMRTNHVKWTFAPFLGLGLLFLLLLDYGGYIFSYTPSASETYVLLICAFVVVFSFAWFGAEMILETRQRYKSIELALLAGPITIISVGLFGGLSLASHQVLFRTFDFADFFIFIGVGIGIVTLHARSKRLYDFFGLMLVVLLLVTFPFAYASSQLLGVRHDTQDYELDALEWTRERSDVSGLQSDQRIAYLALRVYGLPAEATLPQYLRLGIPTPVGSLCVVEDDWAVSGVNDYPRGELVLSKAYYLSFLEMNNVVYAGGPVSNHLYVSLLSEEGHAASNA